MGKIAQIGSVQVHEPFKIETCAPSPTRAKEARLRRRDRPQRQRSQLPTALAHRYPTVHQMTTTVRAQLLQQLRPVDAVFSCFPCGSITGAPKVLSIGQHQRIRATLA